MQELQASRMQLTVNGGHIFMIWYKVISVILDNNIKVKYFDSIRRILRIEPGFNFVKTDGQSAHDKSGGDIRSDTSGST